MKTARCFYVHIFHLSNHGCPVSLAVLPRLNDSYAVCNDESLKYFCFSREKRVLESSGKRDDDPIDYSCKKKKRRVTLGMSDL